MNGQVVYSYKPLPGAEKRIYDKISDITISMKAADHLKMPELVSSEYRVYMEEPEQAIYDEMCEDLTAQLDKGEVTAANCPASSPRWQTGRSIRITGMWNISTTRSWTP